MKWIFLSIVAAGFIGIGPFIWQGQRVAKLEAKVADLESKCKQVPPNPDLYFLQIEHLCKAAEAMTLQNAESSEAQDIDYYKVQAGECVLCFKNYIERTAHVTYYGANANKEEKIPFLRLRNVPLDVLKDWPFHGIKKAPFLD